MATQSIIIAFSKSEKLIIDNFELMYEFVNSFKGNRKLSKKQSIYSIKNLRK